MAHIKKGAQTSSPLVGEYHLYKYLLVEKRTKGSQKEAGRGGEVDISTQNGKIPRNVYRRLIIFAQQPSLS